MILDRGSRERRVEATRREQGEKYATYILDRANIGTELGNRVAMGTGVQPPRFRWVPYVDALLFPLDNSDNAGPAATPDRRQFFPLEDKLRAQYILGFYPPNGVKPGSKWHEISVQVGEGRAKTIRGYYP